MTKNQDPYSGGLFRTLTHEFDDIRPYYDSEIPAAMQRIAASTSFPLLASYVYPGQPLEDVRRRIAAYPDIKSFQHETMSLVN